MPSEGTISQGRRNLLSQLRERLRQISQTQENLNDAREELLVERSGVQSRGKRLRAQRARTRNAEAAFMTAVRDFYKEAGYAFPAALSAAYEILKQEDDKLGSMEVDYSHKEEALTGKEWEFGEKETSFYQYDLHEILSTRLVDNHDYNENRDPRISANTTFPLLVLFQFQENVSLHGQLMRRFNAFREHQAGLLEHHADVNLDPPYLRFIDEYSLLLSNIMDCEVKLNRLKQELMRHAIPAPMILCPGSAASLDWGELQMQQPPNSLLDGSLPNSLYGFPIRDRVPEWLFTYMKGNALERRRFLGVLEKKLGLPEDSQKHYDWWADYITRFWLSDSSIHFTQPEEDMRTPTPESAQYKDGGIVQALEGGLGREQERAAPMHFSVPSQPSDTTSNIVLVRAVPQNEELVPEGSRDTRPLREIPPAPSQQYVHHDEQIQQHTSTRGNSNVVTEKSAGQRNAQPTIRVECSPDEPSTAEQFRVSQTQVPMHGYGILHDPQPTPVSPISRSDISIQLASNSGLLDVPLAPRYDSCQESDNEESQAVFWTRSRANELCTEPAVWTDAPALDPVLVVHSPDPSEAPLEGDLSKGTTNVQTDNSQLLAPKPENVVSSPAESPAASVSGTGTNENVALVPSLAQSGAIQVDALVEQKQHQVNSRKSLSLHQLAMPINRSKSVSERPTRARKQPEQLQVPLQSRHHRRSKSDNLIHFNREELWKGITCSLTHTLEAR